MKIIEASVKPKYLLMIDSEQVVKTKGEKESKDWNWKDTEILCL